MLQTTMNPFLLRQLARGEYEVDPRAVAEAMLTRLPRQRTASRMFVPLGRLDRFVIAPEEDGPRAA